MKRYFKFLKLYIKYHKDINDLYNFSLKGKYGENVPKGLNWLDRTQLWWSAE